MDENKQQPVAWIWQFPDGEFYETPHSTKEECERDCCGYDGMAVSTYTTQPVPRDALMAALYELSDACLELNGNGIGCDVISAIADRYSDRNQLAEIEKDAARLNFIEKRHDMRLSTRSGKWWAFDKFSNYEQATYATLREAIDAAMLSAALKPESL